MNVFFTRLHHKTLHLNRPPQHQDIHLLFDKPTIPFPISPATVNHRKQTLRDDISDYMINNLRLVEAGVAESDFRSRFGSGLLDVYPKEIEELIHSGLLEKKTSDNSEVFRLTKRGRLLGNQAFQRIVG